ncbi:LOW QUALITY PROTEIN: tRNA wybutosine-synthesizing protein 2 homolog [Mantella aurantiaca]
MKVLAQGLSTLREYLQSAGILDGRYRAQKLDDGTVALPVLKEKMSVSVLRELTEAGPGSSCRETLIKNPVLSKRARVQSPAQKLRMDLCELLEHRGLVWRRNLDHDLPHSWQRHGDLVVLSADCFCDPLWKQLGVELWAHVASFGVKRVAKQGHVQDDGWRSPNVTMLLGDDGWVEHVDNGIRYTFDVTKCMFSAGNIVEKQRLSALCCTNETVVDLYAGIGYFTLPLLVHAAAAFVHACEWNPHAVEALRRNLEINNVSDRCHVHQGDNRELPLEDMADRVNLGLIPTSEAGYPVACKVLRKRSGGVLHIHHNVNCFPGKPGAGVEDAADDKACSWRTLAWRKWAESVECKIRSLLSEVHGGPWRARILQVKRVKSYAPHVDHVVLDLDCRPFPVM